MCQMEEKEDDVYMEEDEDFAQSYFQVKKQINFHKVQD